MAWNRWRLGVRACTSNTRVGPRPRAVLPSRAPSATWPLKRNCPWTTKRESRPQLRDFDMRLFFHSVRVNKNRWIPLRTKTHEGLLESVSSSVSRKVIGSNTGWTDSAYEFGAHPHGGWQVSFESVAKWTDRSPLGFLQCWRWLVLPRVLDPSNSRFWQIISNRACGRREPRRIRDHEEPTYLLEYRFTGSFSISARQIPGPVHHYVQLGRREETLLLCRYARRSASHPATQRLGMYRRLQLGIGWPRDLGRSRMPGRFQRRW
jgi:hypothetical protein